MQIGRQFAWHVKILFPGKNKKNISKCGLLKFLPIMQSDNVSSPIIPICNLRVSYGFYIKAPSFQLSSA